MNLENERARVILGDCRNSLESLIDSGCERPGFVFADPPFNIGEPYGTWDDNLPWDDFVDFTIQWVNLVARFSVNGAVICVNVPDSVVFPVLTGARDSHVLTQVAWVIWHYRFGVCHRGNWINSKNHCLIFAKDNAPHKWYPDRVLEPSDRSTVYNDPRTEFSRTPGMRVPLDVWQFPRVQGNNKERRPLHPNQVPEGYVARLLKAYTDEGDLVFDPFNGSGTTGTVALAMGRRFLGCEINTIFAESAWKRMTEIGAVRKDSF